MLLKLKGNLEVRKIRLSIMGRMFIRCWLWKFCIWFRIWLRPILSLWVSLELMRKYLKV